MSRLYYLNEHIEWPNYQSNYRGMFSEYAVDSGTMLDMNVEEAFCFIFMLKGEIELLGEDSRLILKKDNLYSLGKNINIGMRANSDSYFIRLIFDKPQILCDKFEMIALKKYLPERDVALRVLPMNKLLVDFASSVHEYLNNKMFCRHLYDIKQSEWFFLMRGFYTKKQNAMFFYPLLNDDTSFETMVKEKAGKVSTVNELAAACCMSTKTLTRKFKNHFDTTPKQWLLEQKKQIVKIELWKTDNFKELLGKLGFSSYAHLNGYCLKYFGKSVKELKEDLQNK